MARKKKTSTNSDGLIDRRQSTARIQAEIEQLSRAPLVRELTKWLAAGPDPEALATFANRQPDRWSQGVGTLARAAGFNEAPSVQVSIEARAIHLSDSEVAKEFAIRFRRLRELEQRMQPALPGEQPAIEADTDGPEAPET